MTTYQEETGPAKGQLEKIIRNHFPELCEATVTVTLMFAANPDGPAVKHHGCPCVAKIKVNDLADRAEGKADVTITVDAEIYDGKTGGRPKLGTIPDSYTINGFWECAERYGVDSPEYASIVGVVRSYRQLKLWEEWDQDTLVIGEPGGDALESDKAELQEKIKGQRKRIGGEA